MRVGFWWGMALLGLAGLLDFWRDISDTSVSMSERAVLRVEERAGTWKLVGPGAERFVLVNDYLGYLADRNYPARTVRAYALDLLQFARWLEGEGLTTTRTRSSSMPPARRSRTHPVRRGRPTRTPAPTRPTCTG